MHPRGRRRDRTRLRNRSASCPTRGVRSSTLQFPFGRAMHTTFDDIPEPDTLGIADDVVAPRTVFDSTDSAFAVVRSAFRTRQLDGREPHVVEVLIDGTDDVVSLFPAEARLLRSVIDEDDDAVYFARGADYSL